MRSSTRWFRASDDTRLVRLVGQRAWLQERNVVFGVDLDGPTLGPSFALGDGEELREIEGSTAVVQTSDKGLRGVDIESGEEQWRIEPDDRFYLDRRRSFSIRWWYESTETATHVRRLDLASGEFGDAQVLEHESFSAPVLYSWADKDLLATGRGRDVHIVYADGRAPERRRLPMAPGGDARFIFPFAGTWYVQGTGEGAEGPFTRLVPLDAERPTLQCEELAYPSIASGDRLAIVSSDGHAFAYVWAPNDEQPSKRYLGEGRFARAVAAGPHTVALVGSTLHVQGGTGEWSTFEAPTDSLVRIEDRDGAPMLVMSGGGLALCPIAEMAELGPGSHPHPVQTVPVPMPAPPAAEVTYVGKATGTGIAMHPQFGRLTFKATEHPGVAKGDQIEVLTKAGGSIGDWKPLEIRATATPRDDVLAAPDPIGSAPEPEEPEPFESSRMLERWRARSDAEGVETPALLKRMYEVYDRGALERSTLERLFVELDPEAALDEDVVELLAEVGEDRHLVGFARDVEGNPIGFVAGDAGVYKVDEGELWEADESFEEWVEEQLDSLAKDGSTELVERIRKLLEFAGPDSN